MRFFLSRFALYASLLQAFQNPMIQAGLNQFTEIDSFGKWTIEQKFNYEKNKVECRASIKGYGTWFGERIRLDGNGQVLIPEDVSYKNKVEIFDQLIEVRKALSHCRSSLLYIRK